VRDIPLAGAGGGLAVLFGLDQLPAGGVGLPLADFLGVQVGALVVERAVGVVAPPEPDLAVGGKLPGLHQRAVLAIPRPGPGHRAVDEVACGLEPPVFEIVLPLADLRAVAELALPG